VSNYQFVSSNKFLCFWLKDILAPDSISLNNLEQKRNKEIMLDQALSSLISEL